LGALGIHGCRRFLMARKIKVNPQYIGGDLADLKRELMENPDYRLGWGIHEVTVELGRCVSEMRNKANLTQAQLAERLGVSQSLIARLESGRPERTPTLPTLIRVAKACGF